MQTLTYAQPTTAPAPAAAPARRPVTVDEYKCFRRDGFLIVRGLVAPHDIDELRGHTEDLMQGRLPEQSEAASQRDAGHAVAVHGLEAPPAHLSPEEKAQFFLRIHMLHRQLALHERYMLHPGVLDVLETLIGPDVLALQTMLFLKGPGQPGQGWHQDSYYIPTHPDTLCGAWVAIDDVDEMNGAMWFAAGSQVEPVYPPREGGGNGDKGLAGIVGVGGVSNPDDTHNDLARTADIYPQLLAGMRAGDVAFFGGHVLHRSKANWSVDRFRRAFVGHYCNARAWTQWGADTNNPDGTDPLTGMANGSHILARGDTHLPFAQPRFGTPCAALLTPDERRTQTGVAAMMMADRNSGLMGVAPADPNMDDDD